MRIPAWSAPDVVRVPVSALFGVGSRWSVFAVDGERRARQRVVEIGPMNDELAAIRQGLRPGERVILHPSEKIADGARVREAGA